MSSSSRVPGSEPAETGEERCFLCKDAGGYFRACDFRNCPKSYHPACVEVEYDLVPSPGYEFICGWHTCFNCKGSSHFQCLCCPTSVCHDCLGKVGFAELRTHRKGFCTSCLNKAILIEKNVDSDPHEVQTGYGTAEISNILFKDYWEDIKDREHVTLVYLEEAHDILNRKLDCYRANSEKFSDEAHQSDANMFAENAFIEKTIPFDSKGKQNKVNTSLKTNNSNLKTYIGWGSKELIHFLSSFGKDTSKSLGEVEILEVIIGYIKEKNLFNDNKKKSFSCDNKLHPLFGRKRVRCKSIRRFLAVHLAANAVSEDENFVGSDDDDDISVIKKKPRFDGCEDDDVPITFDGSGDDKVPTIKKKHGNNLELKITESVSKRNKRCFASLNKNNIKLIYLRRTLVINLLNHPNTFDQKVVGCFVRVKNAPKVHKYEMPKKPYQLGLVTGIKKSSEEYKIKDTCTNILLCVTGLWEDIMISMLSDEDIEEEECNDLVSLVKKGLLKRPTIAALEEKVAIVQKDIVNHWIDRELVRLDRAIDRANIKGWREEFEELMDKQELLRTEAERMRRLEEIPNIVAATEEENKTAASNSSQENRGNTNTFLPPLSAGAKQQIATSLSDTQEENRKDTLSGGIASPAAAEKVVESIGALKERSTKDKKSDNASCFMDVKENSKGNTKTFLPPLSLGAKQQEANSLNDHQERLSKGAPEHIVEFLGVLNKKPTAGNTKTLLLPHFYPGVEQKGDSSLNDLHLGLPKGPAEDVVESLKVLKEKPTKAGEAGQGGTTPDSSLHSQMHNTQVNADGSSTEAMDIDKDGSKFSRRKNGGTNIEEAINLDIDEDEDLQIVEHRTGGNTSPSLRAMNLVSPLTPLWHYADYRGNIKGPFPLMSLFKWRGFFDKDLKVWRTGETVEQAILLTDAFLMMNL